MGCDDQHILYTEFYLFFVLFSCVSFLGWLITDSSERGVHTQRRVISARLAPSHGSQRRRVGEFAGAELGAHRGGGSGK